MIFSIKSSNNYFELAYLEFIDTNILCKRPIHIYLFYTKYSLIILFSFFY